ncbi:MAG: class I SAM-dependent methyltransferase [Candidatus Pacearchaeota archaeon]
MKIYQDLAKMYDLLYSYRNYGKEADFLIGNLPSRDNSSLLDVACGTGVHLEAVKKRLPEARLEGLDLNQGMLDVAEGKSLCAQLTRADMRNFNLGRNFDIVYCLSSSIQYNLSKEDFKKAIDSMRRHAIEGKVIFDLAYCAERWKEGYTNITANSDERLDVAELYTSHSSDGFSCWNPLYLIKDKKTGKMDMHVDKHKIKLWSISEVEDILSSQEIPFKLKKGYSEIEDESGIPIFILEGLKR